MAHRRMRAGERRGAILQAAAEVFAMLSYEGATTAKLAQAAQISEPMLYRHFPDKEHLFCAVLDWAATEVISDWERITSGISNTREKILALTALAPYISKGSSNHYRLLQSAHANTNNPRIRSTLRTAYQALEGYLTKLIKSGQACGELRQDLQVNVAAWTMLSLVLAYCLTNDLNLDVSNEPAWEYGAGSRYLDTLS